MRVHPPRGPTTAQRGPTCKIIAVLGLGLRLGLSPASCFASPQCSNLASAARLLLRLPCLLPVAFLLPADTLCALQRSWRARRSPLMQTIRMLRPSGRSARPSETLQRPLHAQIPYTRRKKATIKCVSRYTARDSSRAASPCVPCAKLPSTANDDRHEYTARPTNRGSMISFSSTSTNRPPSCLKSSSMLVWRLIAVAHVPRRRISQTISVTHFCSTS